MTSNFSEFSLPKLGVSPITGQLLSSPLESEKLFKSPSTPLIKSKFYGGCSLTVECGTVDPETGVQLSPSAFRDNL